MQRSTLVSLPPELIQRCLEPLDKADLARAEACCRQLKAAAGGLLADWRGTIDRHALEAPICTKLLAHARAFKRELSQPVTDYIWHMVRERAKYLKKDLGITCVTHSCKTRRYLELISPGGRLVILFYVRRPGSLAGMQVLWDSGLSPPSCSATVAFSPGRGTWQANSIARYREQSDLGPMQQQMTEAIHAIWQALAGAGEPLEVQPYVFEHRAV